MHKIKKKTFALTAIMLILVIILLAACTSTASANVCHATGDMASPYEEITIDSTESLNEHRLHSNDIFPVPQSGCPESPVEIVDGNVAICHATSSETNPYEEITVNVNGLNGHGNHEEDIIPMPDGGCSASPDVTSDDTLTVCHATDDTANPYEELVVTSAELNEHLAHPNDINPALTAGCPAYPVVIHKGEITICHANGNESIPYDEIMVSVNGLDGHGEHEGDIFPASNEDGCPATSSLLTGAKITICHATSSAKNPYNEITVSVNGLNGHDKHAGDIIPAPAEGCPTNKP